jgi:hypothetical protein
MRLLQQSHAGIIPRSFGLQGAGHARETIAEICSPWAGFATAPVSPSGF